MLLLLSPAKSLEFERPAPHDLPPTLPRFGAEAAELAHAAAKLTAPKLQALMDISPNLAKLNVARFRGFDEAATRPALHAFAGDVYRGFEAATLDPPAIRFAQDHVRILSGLYGLLRPLDRIRPYRLEMGTRWAPGRKKDLYARWGSRISDLLARDLAGDDSGAIVNLASQEYWRAVGACPPERARIVTMDFREQAAGEIRFNSFAAKRARGMMARYACEYTLTDVADLKGFDSDGYAFAGESDDGATWHFVRR